MSRAVSGASCKTSRHEFAVKAEHRHTSDEWTVTTPTAITCRALMRVIVCRLVRRLRCCAISGSISPAAGAPPPGQPAAGEHLGPGPSTMHDADAKHHMMKV